VGFFAPWFLAGIVGIGLPIWLHLLKRHKMEPKPFASLMFFERRTQSSVKHRRLLYKLLMAFRLLMIALLVLLFAEPFFRRSTPVGGGERLLVGVVDHTFSMRAGNALARAKGEIHSAMSKRAPTEQGQIIALGQSVEVVNQPTADSDELNAAIDSISPGDGRATYGDLARYLRTLAASVKKPIEVHLASDFQKSAMPNGFAEMQLPDSVTLVPHRVSSGKSPNWAVETVTAPGSVTDPKKVVVAAMIRGYETDAGKKSVILSVNGKTLQTKTVDVPANGRARVEFVGLDASYGLNRGEVKIDGADSLDADNHFNFGFERSEPRKILFAYDAREARAVTYYKAALEAAGDSPFSTEAVPCDLIAGQTPSKYAFVVLADCAAMAPPFEQALRDYVQQGGSILITLGPASLSRDKVPVANLPIEGSRYAGRDAERFLSATHVDGGHPVTRTSDAFEGVMYYQSAKLKADPPSRVIARLSDGSPLLVETPIGEGRVLTFASTIDNIANDFPLHPNFVAFAERSANYLGRAVDRPSSALVGSTVELRSVKSAAAVEVNGPDGKPVMSLSKAATARTYAFPKEGYFEVTRAGSSPELYAVNADRRESDLEALPQETIDLWKNTGHTDAANSDVANPEQAEREHSFSPWRWILFILLLVAIAETLVGNRYLGEVSGESEKPLESSKEAA
jgi:hypothetical protein